MQGDPSVIGEGPREAKQEKAKQEGLRGWIKSGTERRGLLARWRVRAGDVDGMQRPCAGRESGAAGNEGRSVSKVCRLSRTKATGSFRVQLQGRHRPSS